MAQPPDKRYRVAVWATGGVGRYAIRTIMDRPNLELAGAWVHSEAKDGQDVGVLAGIDPVGVTATRDADALLASGVDCVMYAAPAGPRPAEALADFCRILSSGTNVSQSASSIRSAKRQPPAAARSSRRASNRASAATSSR